MLAISGAFVLIAAVFAGLRVCWVLTRNSRLKQTVEFSQIIRKLNKLD